LRQPGERVANDFFVVDDVQHAGLRSGGIGIRLVAFLVKMTHPANPGAPQTGF
jgi:hypothetical protein